MCKTYMLFFDMCFFSYPVLVCPIPKIWYLFIFACGLTVSSYQKKLYQTKTCSIESYNIEIKHEEK